MAAVSELPESLSPVRMSSPDPSASPTPAITSCPDLERCVSTASTVSDISGRALSGNYSSVTSAPGGMSNASVTSTPSVVGNPSGKMDGRRRGYMRPQGTEFASSAKSRESVMSLGSITHLQYYFARTGLLDGKGGQMYVYILKHNRPS
jgi:hypothetical protein